MLLTEQTYRMQYADGAMLELEGQGLLELTWGYWPGVYAYLSGSSPDAVLSYDISLLGAEVHAESVRKARRRGRRRLCFVER